MPINPALIIICAGGHAKVVLDAAYAENQYPSDAIICIDDTPALIDTKILNTPVYGPIAEYLPCGSEFHIALGDNQIRQDLANKALAAGGKFASIKHPDRVESRFAEVSAGVFLAAKSIVAPNAFVGMCTIVNHGAVIDHDCEVGAFCHIAPNASICGGVTIGERVLIGANATILKGIQIGDGAIIGAGACVTENVPAYTTVAGVPAKKLKT